MADRRRSRSQRREGPQRFLPRSDIDPANTWVTSDHHFGHENIVPYFSRPADHEQVMMERWARAVPEHGATLVHLGDLCYRANAMFKHVISKHLNPKVDPDAPPDRNNRRLLVKYANHDRSPYNFYRKSGFKQVAPFQIEYEGHTISFSHYPLDPRDERFDLTAHPGPPHVHIHGHTHSAGYTREAFVPLLPNQINVSVEVMHYTPVNLKTLLDGYLFGIMPGELLDEGRAEQANP